VDAELRAFLQGYCSVCKKDRGGKLCGCSFPCSLSFKAHMRTKIHEILGLGKPNDKRAIQVRTENSQFCPIFGQLPFYGQIEQIEQKFNCVKLNFVISHKLVRSKYRAKIDHCG